MTTNDGAKSAHSRAEVLWTASFAVLCVTVLLGYAQQALLTPTIPLYVTDQGGSALLAGLALLAFSVPSFVVRPVLGHLSDTWSASGVLTIGLVLLTIGALLYLTPWIAMIFVAAAVRGVGWGGLNTGGYTLLAAASPAGRRGEASGYYTSITTAATIAFPAIALWLIDGPGSFTLVFAMGATVSAIGAPVSHFVMRRLVTAEAASQAASTPSSLALAPAPAGLVDRGVLLATSLNLASTLAYPAVVAFLPLYARELGIGNIGFFYVIAGVTSIIIRPVMGRKSDSIGRGPSIALAFMSSILGLLLIVFAQNLPMILLGGVFTALGQAINSSATTALAMDLANPAGRGKAMATFSVSFQLGAGIGAIFAGAIADLAGYRFMYVGSIAIIGLGFVVLALSWRALTGAPGERATA